MPDVKISAAADAGTLVATDKVPLARSASTTAYSATMAEIASWTNTNLPVASTSVAGVVKVDGTTITISSGTISSAAAPPASSSLPYMDGTAAPGVATSWSRGDHVHPSDTAKAPLASPTFTGTPAAPTPTTGDNTTRIATTAFVQSQMVASGAGVSTWNTRAGAVVLQQSDITAVGALNDTGRNLIHNGLFTVAQRGAGPFTTNAGYTMDRWLLSFTSDTVQIGQFAIADAGRASIGDESAAFTLNAQFTGNAAAGAFSQISQRIENVRRLAGNNITVSFWARYTAGTPKLGVSIYQNFGTGGSPSASVFPNGQSVTLAGANYVRFSVTFAVPSVAGKTLGTAGDFTALEIWFSSGATNNTRAGGIGVQTGTVDIWGIQLEIGSVATPLAKREYAEELRLAMRYYQTGTVQLSGPGTAGTSNSYQYMLPVPMRIAPTATPGTPSSNLNAGSPSINVTAVNATLTCFPAATSVISYANTFTASADL